MRNKSETDHYSWKEDIHVLDKEEGYVESLSTLSKEEKVSFLVEQRAKKRKKKISSGYFFIAPWYIAYLVFAVVPIGMSIYMSFMDWPVIGEPTFVGLDNFKNIFRDPKFIESLWVTARFAIVSIPLGMVASFTVALIMSSKTRGLNVYRTIYYLPAVVSGVAIGIVWRWILDPRNGLLNNFLRTFGIVGPGWLTDPNWVLPSYMLIGLWGAGAGMLTYLVALNEVPNDLHEAASLQGAKFFRRLFHITVPYIRPILYYNLIMGIIGAFKQFNIAYIVGGAGHQGRFILLYIYETAFGNFRMGYASAMSWVFLVIVLLVTMFVFRFTDFWKYSQSNEEE